MSRKWNLEFHMEVETSKIPKKFHTGCFQIPQISIFNLSRTENLDFYG